MKKYKIQIRSQKNSQSCVPLTQVLILLPSPHQLVVYYSALVPTRFLLLCSGNYQTPVPVPIKSPAPVLQYLPDSGTSAPVSILVLCSSTYSIPDSCTTAPAPILLICSST